jgi:transcriptional regulator with XRE-family HTH domain
VTDETMSENERVNWAEWMRALGRQVRRVREFLGLSQEQLAKSAGVSQGAVSRLEAGRGLATPLLVVLRIHRILHQALRAIEPSLLNEPLRRALELDDVLSPMPHEARDALPGPDTGLAEFLALYDSLPPRERQTLISVVRATAEALAGASPLGVNAEKA